MGRHKWCQFPFFMQLCLLLSYICLCRAWDISSQQDASKQCAEIFFQASFNGSFIQLGDNEQLDLANIQHHFFKKDKPNKEGEVADEPTNNEIGTETAPPQDAISFRVQEGCNLKLSSRAYLKDDVHQFTEDVEEMGWFIPKSASCQCPKVFDILNSFALAK